MTSGGDLPQLHLHLYCRAPQNMHAFSRSLLAPREVQLRRAVRAGRVQRRAGARTAGTGSAAAIVQQTAQRIAAGGAGGRMRPSATSRGRRRRRIRFGSATAGASTRRPAITWPAWDSPRTSAAGRAAGACRPPMRAASRWRCAHPGRRATAPSCCRSSTRASQRVAGCTRSSSRIASAATSCARSTPTGGRRGRSPSRVVRVSAIRPRASPRDWQTERTAGESAAWRPRPT